ncbi:Aspartyl-tRNA(Asn) amidotransferase subunit B @ Glutamyl-tRNA(Gln) amidotransferase subunit B [hydrothermal vent metagenome]|uniref:Aspartyl-tRNA(Asn) amidotransferase subunit B @ Glutamyl-tRNA(Gln) amidotransferase subunit B n=1 Tax=hydrothermal vent metagenome TaxID=652676 RepID=A0A3B1E8Z1_9ZZZZ
MFEVVIGLEVHIQLNTKTKLFCSCDTSFGDKANTHVCPVCIGLPGALPVLNKDAVKKSIALGTALNSTINKISSFERKNYFYPDLPSGYQISQFEIPVVEGGALSVQYEDGTDKTFNITRAHLETDAGKNIHENDNSLVDLNRAGTPLLEIVSEPELRSSTDAVLYLKKLHSIVRYLDISDASMQEGSFRCDANVSIRPKGDTKLYTRVEIKNLNSFKFIQKAIEYEVIRQSEAWEDGDYEEKIVQETRLYDSVKNETRSMRGKEEAADYRYFPDPDLLPVFIDDKMIEKYSKIPELPDAKKQRFIKDYGLTKYDATLLTSNIDMVKFFEQMLESTAKNGKQISGKNAVNWLSVELQGRLKGEVNITNSPVDAIMLGQIVQKIEDSTISGKGAKDLLDYVMQNNTISIDEAIDKLNIKQVSDDGAILEIIQNVLDSNTQKVDEYKNGKEKLFGFFVGQVMKLSKGSANPQKVNELLKNKLH